MHFENNMLPNERGAGSIAVMQPYFFPYLGYWQLMHSVDTFVLFDDVNFIKKGYINRNNITSSNGDMPITLPLVSASQNKKINEIEYLTDKKIIKKIEQSYSKSINFKTIIPIVNELLSQPPGMLIDLLEFQISVISRLLRINAEIIRSSSLQLGIEGREKIYQICKSQGKSIYKNPIGGRDIYKSEDFENLGIELRFVKSKEDAFAYSDGKRLSIIDFLMRVPESEWGRHLNLCEELEQ